MNTKQQLLFSLLFATSFTIINAMEKRPITFHAAQINFNNSWNALSQTPEWKRYRRSCLAHMHYHNRYSKFMFLEREKIALNAQKAQEFIKWYKVIQSFNKCNTYETRQRSQSAPTKRQPATSPPRGSEII